MVHENQLELHLKFQNICMGHFESVLFYPLYLPRNIIINYLYSSCRTGVIRGHSVVTDWFTLGTEQESLPCVTGGICVYDMGSLGRLLRVLVGREVLAEGSARHISRGLVSVVLKHRDTCAIE